MSSDIKPGDLVMVVKPIACCGSAKNIGKIFTVISWVRNHNGAICPSCGFISRKLSGFVLLSNETWCQAVRLKKIEPLDDAESESANKHLEAV